jgi:acyl carrier protein
MGVRHTGGHELSLEKNREEVLEEFFIRREGAEIVDSLKDVDLLETGLLDSLDVIELAVYLENELDLKIDLTQENSFKAMRRFSSILELIGK